MSNTEAPTLFARQVELKWRRAKKLIYGERILRHVAEGNKLYTAHVSFVALETAGNDI